MDSSITIRKDRRTLSRCSNLRNPSTATAAIQAITQARSNSNGGSVVRVRLVMSQKELKQMVASMGWGSRTGTGHNSRASTTTAALDQLVHLLKKRQTKRPEFGRGDRSSSSKWEPALQSIPEELFWILVDWLTKLMFDQWFVVQSFESEGRSN